VTVEEGKEATICVPEELIAALLETEETTPGIPKVTMAFGLKFAPTRVSVGPAGPGVRLAGDI
jgi:hypothetical protein